MRCCVKIELCVSILLCRSVIFRISLTSADYSYGPPNSTSESNSTTDSNSVSEWDSTTESNSASEWDSTSTTSISSSPLIAHLRSRIDHLDLDPYYTSDKQLAQYIESSNYNVEFAAGILVKTAYWRKASGANYILNSNESSVLTDNLPYECTGYTEEGNPVFYVPVGTWNFRAVRRAKMGRKIYKHYNRILEEIRRSTEGRINPKTGEPVDQAVLIENLNGFSLKSWLFIRNNQLINIFRYFHNINKFYPFMLKKYIIVKAPLAFQALRPVVRKIFPRLSKRLSVYNRFSIRYSADLFHNVPENAIPCELGGTYVSKVSHLYGYRA